MTRNAITALVTSLGDFPLEPDSGSAWLWAASGEHLLWASEQAFAALKLDDLAAAPSLLAPERFKGLATDLKTAAPHLEPIRVQQLVLQNGALAKTFTCLCRPVALRGGGYGILAVAIGAPARSLHAMEEMPLPAVISPRPHAAATDAPHNANRAADLKSLINDLLPASPVEASLVETSPVAGSVGAAPHENRREIAVAPQIGITQAATDRNGQVAQVSLVAGKVIDTRLEQRSSEPTWMSLSQDQRRPLRFVWQTDAKGIFIHLSRELAEAIGPTNTMLIGLNWDQAVMRFGILEGEDIALGFQSRDTWTARASLWPVRGTNQAVPVEMAGMPVHENGVYAGFRGYGIARVERAVDHPYTAAQALAYDKPVDSDPAYERFGPAVKRAIAVENTAKQVAPSTDGIEPADTLIGRRNPLPTTSPLPTAMLEPTHHAESKPALTRTEREAFREIARALSKSGQEAAELPTSRADEPEDHRRSETETNPSLQADQAQETGEQMTSGEQVSSKAENRQLSFERTPHEPIKDGSLQALKKALSKRTRFNFEQESFQAEAQSKPATPVISYDALQARREQRSRADATQAPWTTIIERLPIGLMVQQHGQIVFANRHLLDLAGYGDFEDFQSSIRIEQFFVGNTKELAGNLHAFEIAARNGEKVQVDATLQATTWNDAPATLMTIRRISDMAIGPQYKALELDLLSSRAELREVQSVLDTATDGIIALDGEGRILSLNRSAEALFGFDQNEITGENLTVLLEPESHIAALDYLEGLKSNGVNSIMNDGRDVKGRERNGGVLPLFMTIGRVGEGQRASRFCVVLRDITHWKKVESDLTEAKRAAEDSSAHKTDFLAKVSHEIRTPLNAIIGFSQVMIAESFGPIGNERYRQYAKDINASGEHIVSLVNDLLDLSKVASGKLELSFGSVDVNAIVAGCVAMIQPQANAGKVIVRSQLGAHLPMVVADERSVRQIVINLLSNAAKFTEAGGQVIASTSFTDSGEVVIRVRDTGIGMGEDDVRRALEPFRQIPGPRSSGGTGLGLPLTKALAEANRANFALHSEPGKGTLVEVTFPSTRVLAE
ncbi:MAG: PAS domain S-box protein [Beijerinckiaceae bacterium]